MSAFHAIFRGKERRCTRRYGKALSWAGAWCGGSIIDGDGQGDLAGHGGEHRAVFVYQIGSYRYWEEQLRRKDFTFGQFGENFTVEGLADDEVCIGDRYRIGSALFEVTQPRVTCYRVGIRTNEPRMAALLVQHHRPGFYFRVLEEGEVGAGDEIVKVAGGPLHMTVAQTDALLYLPGPSREELQKALEIPALSEGWKGSFRAMLLEEQQGKPKKGASGLSSTSEPPPAWPGFRRLRVARMTPESKSVMSLVLEPADDLPLSPALPGQFVVLRMRPTPDAPAVLRNYSLSDTPSSDHYRISVKHEVNGVASTYLHTKVRQGDVLEVSAPRGSFTLLPDDSPVVLLERRSGRDSGVGDAARAGGRSVATRSVVGLRCKRWRRSSLPSGGSRVDSVITAGPGSHSIQPASSGGSSWRGLRCSWSCELSCTAGNGSASRGRLLSVWSNGVSARFDCGPERLGR